MSNNYVQEMIKELDHLEWNDRSKYPLLKELIKSIGELQQEVSNLKSQLNTIGKNI